MFQEGMMPTAGPKDPVMEAAVYAAQIKGHEKIRVYHNDGHVLFEGTPREVANFWGIGGLARVEEVGSIADAEGQTIVKINNTNESGSIARNKVEMIMGALAMDIEDADIAQDRAAGCTLSPEEQEAELRRCYSIKKQVEAKHGEKLQEHLLMMSLGINPENEEPLFRTVSGEVGHNFEAHGIEKNDQLEKLLALLENGINKEKPFSTAPFELPPTERGVAMAEHKVGSGVCYQSGMAVVTGGYREDLVERGIKYVFINDVYAELLAPLRKLFPQYKIHLLSFQKEVLDTEFVEHN